MSHDHVQMRKLALAAGVLYLVVIVCAGFSQGYVRGTLIVQGDAAATAQNLLTNAGLFRLGFATDLVAFLCDAVLAVLFYLLLRPVSRPLAMVAAALRLVAHPAIAGLNLLNHLGALYVLEAAAPAAAFEVGQLQALALMLLEGHTVGYLIAGAFFGLHLAVLGYLLVRSEFFPSLLGLLIAMAAMGYLLESFGRVLLPGHDAFFALVVGATAAVGEVSLCLWLLVKGGRRKATASQ